MKNHIAFKFIALLLAAATLALALGSGAAIVVLAEAGLFTKTLPEMRKERLESASMDLTAYLVDRYAYQTLSDVPQDILEECGAYGDLYHHLYYGYAGVFQDGEWFYTIHDEAGNLLYSDENIPTGLETYTHIWNAEYPKLIGIINSGRVMEPGTTQSMETGATTPDSQDGPTATYVTEELESDESLPVHWQQYPRYTLTQDDGAIISYYYYPENSAPYTVTLHMTEDAFPIYTAADWQLLEVAATYRYPLLYALAGAVLLFAICLVYLCCSAGRKPGTDEVRPAALNVLPLDGYAAAVALGCFCCVMVAAMGFRWLDHSNLGESFLPHVYLIAAAAFVACLLVVAWIFAFAAQVKTKGGYWWRRSIVGMCVLLLWKGLIVSCRWLHKNVPVGVKSFSSWLVRFCKKLGAVLAKVFTFLWESILNLCWNAWKLTVRFFKWLGGKLNRFYSLLPVTWQWLLVGMGLIFVLMMAVLNRHDTEILLIGLFISIALILYGAHAFGILLEGAKRMSKGDLDTKVSDQFLTGSFKEFAGDLNALADVAVVAAQKQMRSERMKTELITNVSHDIKTPLTSLINYVDLLQKPHTPEEEQEYLEVLSRQSQQLKKLIEDLMEMSKASTGNLSVEISQVDAAEAINQALGEFADKLESCALTPVFAAPTEPVMMKADGRLAWRVLSNLLSNAVKYALPGTRLYIDLVQLDGKVLISLKNISREQLNVDAEELMERFVRGDASRNTEGSGLGLNIAKSLMEVQHGQLQLLIDGDLFKATLIFPGV